MALKHFAANHFGGKHFASAVWGGIKGVVSEWIQRIRRKGRR